MTLEKRIKKIPRDEWWSSSSEQTFLFAAHGLIKKGFSEDEAINLLTSLYFAVSNCYGD